MPASNASSRNFRQLQSWLADPKSLRDFTHLDEAIEWSEDQIIFRLGGFSQVTDVNLCDQELLKGLSPEGLAELESLCERRHYHPGECIIARTDDADSVFFLQRGMVSVKLSDGVRLATLVPGTAFGELALLGGPRSADVFADNPVLCQRISLDKFNRFPRSPAGRCRAHHAQSRTHAGVPADPGQYQDRVVEFELKS